uniref:Fibrocystin isoform X9 n=1 Tax=Geotrypetes seraphini TaxID=260995 RepID=A0A6P8QAA6_GEOSA|nr:fibrocystin isoform X9 [Geotrypetes seraphini]
MIVVSFLAFLNTMALHIGESTVSLNIEPKAGSVAGGTWIILTFDGLSLQQLDLMNSANGSVPEVYLVNPDVPKIPCDVQPVLSDLSVIKCKTRMSQQEGLYRLEVIVTGQAVNYVCDRNCMFKFSSDQTPVIYQVNPPSGVPGNLIQITGWIISGRYETYDFHVEYINGPAILEAEEGWLTVCSFVNKKTRAIYPVQMDRGHGTLQCCVEGNHIGSQNVSFSIFNKGRSIVSKDAWLISAKQELFLYQTHPDIISVFPVSGSLQGGTDIIIKGDFFLHSAKVTVAGVPCTIKYISPNKIECTTGSADNNRFTTIKPGNRGLLFEVWEGPLSTNLTEGIPGYRWKFVPNASTPLDFLPKVQQLFSARLRGFFVAPETNNYTFWIQGDDKACLYLSHSEDPEKKEKIACIPANISRWPGYLENNWNDSWQEKSQKFELIGGMKYYLEALHHGMAPTTGMSIGVQIHNTWLSPDVVNTYHREKIRIEVSALRFPEIQTVKLSGTGWVSFSWDNTSTGPIPTNATADQIKTAIEEILSVKCKSKPSSDLVLFRMGFETGLDDCGIDGHLTSGTEPFCGRYSILRPKHLIKCSKSTIPRYELNTYSHVCFAYKGFLKDSMNISLSYTNVFQKTVKKKLTCLWNFNESSPGSWKFGCINFWRDCAISSGLLRDLLKNSVVFMDQIDLFPQVKDSETRGWFYVDEVIVSSRHITVFQIDPKPARPGGNIIETISVTRLSHTFKLIFWVANCGVGLPFIAVRRVFSSEEPVLNGNFTECVEYGNGSRTLTVERLQNATPPLGGTFKIQLSNTVISGVPVNISSYHLKMLLQGNSDNFTAQYINSSDFTVLKDLSTCYHNIYSLSWTSMTGDLPNMINVSAENLTGLNPSVKAHIVYDGGVFIGPIFGDMLATANQLTQVTVQVNDIPASCSGACSFQYLQEVTPLITDIQYSSDDGIRFTVYITGSGFSEDEDVLQINIHQTSCNVTHLNATSITCFMDAIPIGVYRVALLVRPYGFALNISGGDIYFIVKPRLLAIYPSTASEIGGIWITIRGTNLNGVEMVLFGSQPCLENARSCNSTTIKCKAPAWAGGNHSVDVTVRIRSQTAVLVEAFKYDASLNPIIVSLSRNITSSAGDQVLHIGMLTFESYTDLNVEVKINEVLAKVEEVKSDGIEVALPLLPEGLYNISVTIHGIRIHSDRLELLIQYVTEILHVDPCCGSFLGGTLLTISGVGFSKNTSLVSVFLNTSSCDIINSTEDKIWCRTPPLPQLSNISQNISVPVQCWVPPLPAGEYQVKGHDLRRGWATSNVTYTSHLTVTSIHNNYGCLGKGEVHIRGSGFSPGNTSVTICGTPCGINDTLTTPTDVRCLAWTLNDSLVFLCSFTKDTEASCHARSNTAIQCDVVVRVEIYRVIRLASYTYICNDLLCANLSENKKDLHFSPACFTGLFFSPKVERDEVLIYNGSCNITMATEAEMECEAPNQPITAKITEIWKNWGQNIQTDLLLQFCALWSRNSSWLSGHPPQDGDNVTVEQGQTLLLDSSTCILNLLHVKGGKLLFVGPGPIYLHAHYILISDGGKLQVGSSLQPFLGKAQIHLYGSSHSVPFYRYGVKFIAVRNATLSLHGRQPEVTFTHLDSEASFNDTKLVLEKAVDWRAGDIIVISGMDSEGTVRNEDIVTIESVNGTEILIKPPLKFPYGIIDQWVDDQHHILRPIVALLSRDIVVQGNLTIERIFHFLECAEAGFSDASKCFYNRSERKLGSRDMGAVVIVQSFQNEPSLIQLEGVQFKYMGQSFQKNLSALNIAGNVHMNDSYIRGCSLWNSFSRGLSLSKIHDLQVENNVFYNIMGHGLQVGQWLEEGLRIRHNALIGVSDTDGLSNIEALFPAGIYIRAPANMIEDNTVFGAGYGYFFHLAPGGPSQTPVQSFSKNSAISCMRSGLRMYPEYLPQRAGKAVITIFQNFRAYGSQGGAQIHRSANLQLQNFQIYFCRKFGLDITESLGNTSVTNSLLIGRFAKQSSSCTLAGLKTPKRFELSVKNTTFVNFDQSSCTAISTCSECYRGQGGFTVKTEKIKFLNSPYQTAFPFPHAAILEDLDGSLSGWEGSHLLAHMDTLPVSCWESANSSGAFRGSVCKKDIVFHRMSIGLKKALEIQYNLIVINSNNKRTIANYVLDTLSNLYGWMILLVDQETYVLGFDMPYISSKLQYVATFDNFMAGSYLLLEHKNLSVFTVATITCGGRQGRLLRSLPSPVTNKGCDWFFNSEQRKLTYLVTGEGQVEVTFEIEERIPLPTAAPLSPPSVPLKWSLPEAWEGIKQGWGGYNHTVPSAGDDIIVLPNRTVVVDVFLPPLKGLYVLGVLEFPVNSSNILSAACIVVAGGELKIGTSQYPLEKEQKIEVVLRASEGVSCGRLDGVNVGPGTIGVYGKLQIHSAYPKKSWTHLSADIAPGNERIVLKDTVDWNPGGKIIIGPSSYEPHQAEFVTLKQLDGYGIRIQERLQYRHIGGFYSVEDRQIHMAAEVGLLTRNIQIAADVACSGRILVGHLKNSSGTEFPGTLQLSNVEIVNLGSLQFSAIAFNNAPPGSSITFSGIHHSCGGGIQAIATSGIFLQDNVVYNTVGYGINLDGRNHTLVRNLIILTMQPEVLQTWVAGIKVTLIDGAFLLANVVAGSERIAFHVRGQECSSIERPWTDNVAHSSLHGVHLYHGDGLQNCTEISGFLSFKNYDYGLMFHVANSILINNLTLIDNVVGLLPVVYGLSGNQHHYDMYIELQNSVIIATSTSFDCIKDRVKPLSADSTSEDRAPHNPLKGRVGIMWPTFTSAPSQWPQSPWHKMPSDPSVFGLMKLQEVTFSGFVTSCYNDDNDVCIMSNPENMVMYPVIAEKTRMLSIKDQNKFYFHSQTSKSGFEEKECPEMECKSSRKALFKDLDGSTLGLSPPVTVFPKSEIERTQSCFNIGVYWKDSNCVYKKEFQGYFCQQIDHAAVIIENMDLENKSISPVMSMTESFVDVFSDMISQDCTCHGKHASNFYSVLPSSKVSKVCFTGPTPHTLRLRLIGGQNTTKILLAIFYDVPLSHHVFLKGNYIPPSPFSSESLLMMGVHATNAFQLASNLLYVLLERDDPIEIYTNIAVQMAFTITGIAGQASEKQLVLQLADIVQIHQSQIRILQNMPGSENTLKCIADYVSKRNLQCPPILSFNNISAQTAVQDMFPRKNNYSIRQLQNAAFTAANIVIVEIGDAPLMGVPISGDVFAPLLSNERLNNLTNSIINAQQTGKLEKRLNLQIDSLVMLQPISFSASDVGGAKVGSFLYVQPYKMYIQIQPSDGEVEKALPSQPKIMFIDKWGQRVENLGHPLRPWFVSVHLQGPSEAALKGDTYVEIRGGWANFSNLAVSKSGSNWYLIFNVTSPPDAMFSAQSRPFNIFPFHIQEKLSTILVAVLSSVASVFTLGLGFYWCKKKNKVNMKIRTKSENTAAELHKFHHKASSSETRIKQSNSSSDSLGQHKGKRKDKSVPLKYDTGLCLREKSCASGSFQPQQPGVKDLDTCRERQSLSTHKHAHKAEGNPLHPSTMNEKKILNCQMISEGIGELWNQAEKIPEVNQRLSSKR